MKVHSKKKRHKAKLSSRFCKINKISVPQLMEMYSLFIQYYNNVDMETFCSDMTKKSGVLLLEKKSPIKRIVGFSTWVELDIKKNGKSAKGVFSGDSVIDRQYWGDKSMHNAGVVQMLKLKLKNPKTPVFWLLISKGYKTYLMLTNNFPKHYPNYRDQNEGFEAIVDEYCKQLYPDVYDEDNRLLMFGDEYQYLKRDVAEITDEMKVNNPNIRHFEELNPTWRQGTELPCVGEISSNMIWEFTKKALNPSLYQANKNRNNKSSAHHVSLNETA